MNLLLTFTLNQNNLKTQDFPLRRKKTNKHESGGLLLLASDQSAARQASAGECEGSSAKTRAGQHARW